MPSLPNNAMLISDLTKLWPDVVPQLRDHGDADLVNRILGNILDRLHRAGKVVPDMVHVTDAPPGVDRAAVLAGTADIDPAWFAAAYARWTNTPLFLRFWDSLSPEEQKTYFAQIPRS